MTTRIRILPEQLCNKIAAGEVVERPASVVKELLENALDAGAGAVSVEVEGGGKRLIRISDDGSGMTPDDVLLCVERHATSKIATDDDLFRLQTFGFRGEALPSIAAVSRLTIRSRAVAAEFGWEVYLEGGTVRHSAAVGLPAGTMVEVRNLFFNTPARRKFLRTDETELGHIGDIVTRLALANPEVRFRLTHNGRVLLDVFGQESLTERVGSLLGRPLLLDLLPLRRESGEGLAIHGLIAQPGQNRASSGAIYTYINGRYIRDRVVQHAVLEGYRNLLMKGRYPVVVLFLDLDPSLVDVNVHPTKHEVRFRDQRTVHDFIAASLRETLRPAPWLENPAGPTPTLQTRPDGGSDPKPESVAGSPPDLRDQVREAAIPYSPAFSSRAAQPAGVEGLAPPAASGTREAEPIPSEEAGRTGGFFSRLTVIGQVRRSFLLCEDEDGLVIVDQHAAHERIGFERLRNQFFSVGIEKQLLLFPEVLDLDFREAASMAEHLGDLARLGFEIEPFGGNSFVVKAVPQLLASANVAGLVRDVGGELAGIGSSGLLENALEAILIRMACHGMVRANQQLGPMEIRALLQELDTVDFRGHCPHGRPVFRRLGWNEIEHMFKRN